MKRTAACTALLALAWTGSVSADESGPYISAGLGRIALRKLDPERQAKYREQFAQIEQLRHVYEHPALVRRSVLDSVPEGARSPRTAPATDAS